MHVLEVSVLPDYPSELEMEGLSPMTIGIQLPLLKIPKWASSLSFVTNQGYGGLGNAADSSCQFRLKPYFKDNDDKGIANDKEKKINLTF